MSMTAGGVWNPSPQPVSLGPGALQRAETTAVEEACLESKHVEAGLEGVPQILELHNHRAEDQVGEAGAAREDDDEHADIMAQVRGGERERARDDAQARLEVAELDQSRNPGDEGAAASARTRQT